MCNIDSVSAMPIQSRTTSPVIAYLTCSHYARGCKYFQMTRGALGLASRSLCEERKRSIRLFYMLVNADHLSGSSKFV